jgi:hypothetical protein
MANSIDNRIRSGSPTPTQGTKETGRTQTATPKAIQGTGSATSESFTTDRDPSRQQKRTMGPMAGAFISPNQGAKTGISARNSLLEREDVLSAASNVMGKQAQQSGVSRLSSVLSGLFGRRNPSPQDPATKADVATLKATRDNLSGRKDLSIVEKETLAVAQRALKLVP